MCGIFVSHSEEDNQFVRYIDTICALLDIECHVAEYKQEAGTDLWDKIQSMIEKSYVVVPILTVNGVKSEWVKKEITMAKTLNKKFIPIVQDLVRKDVPDVLMGKEYISYDIERARLINVHPKAFQCSLLLIPRLSHQLTQFQLP